MFRNTTAYVPTMDKYDLVEGNNYLIQHGKEGLKSVTKYAPGTTTETKDKIVAQTITRFKGRFVRYDIGMSNKYPNGLPGYLTPGREVAVFDQVEIISGPGKRFFTDDIYVIKPSRGIMTTFDVARIDKSGMLREIANPENQTAFATSTWLFANDTQKNAVEGLESGTFYKLANTPKNPNLSQEENNKINVRRQAFSVDEVRNKVSEYLGKDEPEIVPYSELDRSYNEYKNKRKIENGEIESTHEPTNSMNEVDGGFKRRKSTKRYRNKTSLRKRKNTKRYRK